MAGKSYCLYKEGDDMKGPFKLSEDNIERLDDDLYGVYLLTSTGNKGGTIVRYVGRGNIKERLSEHFETRNCTGFCFKELTNEIQGFAEECRLFHDYGKTTNLDNEIHPPRPRGMTNVPKCNQRGCNGEAD